MTGRRKKSETRVKCEKVKNDKHQRILAVFGALTIHVYEQKKLLNKLKI